MSYFIPRGPRSEIKLVSTIRFSIFLKDVAFFSVWVCIFYFFQFLVSPWLVVPYWCLCAISGFYLVRQARRSNPEKRNWEAILLMAGKDHKVYRSFDSHILQAEPAEVPTPSASQGVLSLDIDPDAVPHHGKPKKQKNKKTKKNTSKVPAIDHTVLEAFPIRSWKIVSREGEKGYFLLEDGSILDIFQITGRSYLHASQEEFRRRVEADTFFYRQYRADFKIVSMNYPTMLTKQKEYLLRCAEKQPVGPIRETLLQKADTLDWLENNTTDRQIFFFLFAADEHQYKDLTNLISRSSMTLQEISRGKKESVLWQLNNPCKQLRVQDFEEHEYEEASEIDE